MPLKRILTRDAKPKQQSADSSTSPSLAESTTRNSLEDTLLTAGAREAAIKRLATCPLPADPTLFLQQALTPIFTFNLKRDAVTLTDLFEHHIPRYFSSNYSHRHNIQRYTLQEWYERMSAAREVCGFGTCPAEGADSISSRILLAAALALDWVYIIEKARWKERDLDETARIPCVGIFQIREGKIVEGSVVMDFGPLAHEDPEVACVIA